VPLHMAGADGLAWWVDQYFQHAVTCNFARIVAVIWLLATLCGAQSSENDWLAEPKGLKSRRPAHFIRITAVPSEIAPKQS